MLFLESILRILLPSPHLKRGETYAVHGRAFVLELALVGRAWYHELSEVPSLDELGVRLRSQARF